MKKFFLHISIVIFLTQFAFSDWVILKDGMKYEGEVAEKDEEYEVKTKYGILTISKKDVEKIVKDPKELLIEADKKIEEAKGLYESGMASTDPETKNSKLKEAVGLLIDAYQTYDNVRREFPQKEFSYMDDTMKKIVELMKICRDKQTTETQTPVKSPQQEFKEMYAEIDKKDPEAVLKLATWARERGLYDESKKLLKDVIQIDPDNEEARALLGYKFYEGKWLTAEEYAKKQEEIAKKEVELEKTPEGQELKKALNTFKDGKAEEKINAAKEVFKLLKDNAIPQLFKLLRDEEDESVRNEIIALLQRSKQIKVVAHIKNLNMKTVNQKFAKDIFSIISIFDDKTSAPLYANFLLHKDESVRKMAKDTLLSSKAYIPYIGPLLKSPYMNLRLSLIDVLLAYNDSDGVYWVCTLMKGGTHHSEMRAIIYNKLKDMRKSVVIPGMIEALKVLSAKDQVGYYLNKLTNNKIPANKYMWEKWWQANKQRYELEGK